MSKELRIDFHGVIAFVPNRKFADNPTRVDVVLRDLRTAENNKITPSGEDEPRILDSHHAWLSFSEDPLETDVEKIPEVIQPWKDDSFKVVLLGGELGERVDFILDEPNGPSVEIHDSLLKHLAVYSGQLREQYEVRLPLDKTVAAACSLVGGTLSVPSDDEHKTVSIYDVPLHDGNVVATHVATALRWTIPFQEEVELRLSTSSTASRFLRFRPERQILQIGIHNRELTDILSSALARGGDDDPEFLIYGDSIQGGQPAILRDVDPTVPAGRKACGVGGIQS